MKCSVVLGDFKQDQVLAPIFLAFTNLIQVWYVFTSSCPAVMKGNKNDFDHVGKLFALSKSKLMKQCGSTIILLS